MPTAADTYSTVFHDGTVTLLARVLSNAGVAITQASISTVTYTVYLLDDQDPDVRTAVANHSAVSLTVANVIYDTLQTDAVWTKDATGYNFRHTIVVATNNAFGTVGRNFLVEYKLTPVSGQVIIVRFRLECI
jgi:hypothetical protein